MVLAILLLASLAGCQQLGDALKDRRRRQTPAAGIPSLDQHSLAKTRTPKQRGDVQMALARSFEKQGHVEQAAHLYEDMVQKDSSRADALHRLAVLHDKKGDCKTAERYYRAALKREPDNAEAYCDLGYSYYLQQRWEEAEKRLVKAVSLQPELARAHNNLGLLLARTGREEEALAQFAKAGCSEADARANLAFGLTLDEQWYAAQRQFELALAADPDSSVAKRGLEALRSLTSEAASAPKMLAVDESQPKPLPQNNRTELRIANR